MYDSANQLIRSNSQQRNLTQTWEYDNAGNIICSEQYAYTTGPLDDETASVQSYQAEANVNAVVSGEVWIPRGESEDSSPDVSLQANAQAGIVSSGVSTTSLTPISTITYNYDDPDWGDLLTSYVKDGTTYTVNSDNIGNPLSDGTCTYTWQHGRQLATLTRNGVTWTYTYDADGVRTSRTSANKDYFYVYNGDKLSQVTIVDKTASPQTETVVNLTYDASGTPLTLTFDGTTYYYLTNIQGDNVGIADANGNKLVSYRYDSYGKSYYTSTSEIADTLANIDPLGYRGYVLDIGTALYFLQSRYYDPELGRFINADKYTSTGQGIIGNNMFSYCENNPVVRIDASGEFFNTICGAVVGGFVAAFTRSEKESFGQAFLRGATTGAIAGAALDICIATAGAGAIAIAAVGGATAAALDYTWEQTNKGEEINGVDLAVNVVVGGGMNALFGAAGKEATAAVGNTLKSVGKALLTNTTKSVTNKAGTVVAKKVITETLKNTTTSTIQGVFSKIFSYTGSKWLGWF